MKSTDIARYRMINQQIVDTGFQQPADIVAWLGAMQAQEYNYSKWAIGLRLPGSNHADIENAFSRGDILRTHLLRPTWHFVTPADIRWMLALTAPRVNAANRFMYRKMELDDKLFNRANHYFAQQLQGGKQLTRARLKQALEQKKIITDDFRMAYLLMRAELDGIICSGARAGNQFTYALLDERVPAYKPVSTDEALAELTKRYFKSRGPATIKDFSVWSGLTINGAKRGLDMVLPHFTREAIGNEIYYFPPTLPYEQKLFRHAHILPPYDEYIMGYKNRDAIFVNRNLMHPPPALLFDNTIIIDGQVAGSWKRTIQPKSVDLAFHLFGQLPAKKLAALKRAVRRYSKFTGLPVIVNNKSPVS